MKIGKHSTLILVVVFIALTVFVFLRSKSTSAPNGLSSDEQAETENSDLASIRSFMGDPNLELSFVNTDLPTPYFRVGKVTKVDGGENMEAVDGWIRKVNVYNQKELINGKCSVYEYHTDERNHNLTAVLIKGLKPNEIDALKEGGIICTPDTNTMSKVSKAEAETIAMEYLTRALPNYDQIKDDFVYSQQLNGESHEWLWEDKNYKLPEGLSARPYSNPIIRISVYGDNSIQYWNCQVPILLHTLSKRASLGISV